MSLIQQLNVLHQKKRWPALNPIPTEEEAACPRSRRHPFRLQCIEEPRQPSVERSNRASSFVHEASAVLSPLGLAARLLTGLCRVVLVDQGD